MFINSKSRMCALFAILTAISGCATPDTFVQEPVLPIARVTQNALLELPPPASKLDVAVYKFEDVTGQFKPADGYQNLSRAVSQGGASILVKALQDAGNRSWFTVIERSSLSNLLQERKIITEMRQRYLGETKPDHKFLPPMRFAGILMEGGIVGYDSNTLTGGAGARLLGIGAAAEYRQDTISVNLRAVSVKTGEIMASTLVHKTLISTGLTGSTFSFIDVDKLLEIEAGISTNEPGLIALTKAIEKAVHSLILEGADQNLWAFADKAAARELVSAHRVEAGRTPLPDATPKAIAQKVDTNIAADLPAAAAKQEPRNAQAVRRTVQTERSLAPEESRSANKSVANTAPVKAKSENSTTTPSKLGVTAAAKQRPLVQRKLPVALKSKPASTPVVEGTKNLAKGKVPLVTTVSP